MIGYALAKLSSPAASLLLVLVLGTLLVPGSVMFVPLFVLMAKLDLVEHLLGRHPSVRGRAASASS